MTSDNVSATIEALKEKYDYIFLDTPPVTIVTDAILLSKVCDGFIVVVRQTRAEKENAYRLQLVTSFRRCKELLALYLMALLYLSLAMDIIRKINKYSKYSTYYWYFGDDIVIDVHCHVLPKIDDGSKSVEMSIEMMKQSYAQGIDTMIATPIFT